MLAAKRHTLTFIHAANTHRHDALDDLDNDAIPLVPLTRVHSSTIQQPPPSALSKQHKRRGRMYRYVSHGIGGAGNFRRRVLTSFRSDVTTADPSFGRENDDDNAADATAGAKKQRRNGGDGGGGGVCSCSRCFSRKNDNNNADRLG